MRSGIYIKMRGRARDGCQFVYIRLRMQFADSKAIQEHASNVALLFSDTGTLDECVVVVIMSGY